MFYRTGCGNSSNSQTNAGEAHVKGLEYKVNNLFPSAQMKGAEGYKWIY